MRKNVPPFGKKSYPILRGYRREYFDYLYYLHRYVSIEGIASHGAFNLEQPEVYVNSKISAC